MSEALAGAVSVVAWLGAALLMLSQARRATARPPSRAPMRPAEAETRAASTGTNTTSQVGIEVVEEASTAANSTAGLHAVIDY